MPYFIFTDGAMGITIAQRIFTVTDSFTLCAMPFFMLAGGLMEVVGITTKIVDFAKTHHFPVRMATYVFPPIRNQHIPENVTMSPEEMGRAAAYFDWITLEEEQKQKRADLIRKCLSDEPVSVENQQSRISGCMAGRGAFWISWDGKMYPCGMLSDFTVDAMEQGFAQAWEKTCKWVKTMYLPRECHNCKYQSLCPSCAAVFQSVNQATDRLTNSLCDRTHAYADAFLALEQGNWD
jgi:radical SAM protein with 4Fe4S-binding SPASM domain